MTATRVSTLVGMRRITRLILHRDRLRLTLWVTLLGGVIIASAASLPPVYPEQEDIEQYTNLFGDNPALVAFAGPGYGFDDPNLGVVLVNETQIFGMIGFALMAIFLVNRHTRAEEDVERAEVVRSSVVGRHAPTAAAVAVVGTAIVGVAALTTVGFIALGYATAGSLALGASFAVFGLMFVGVATVAAQVASSGRATLGLASAVLVVTFLLRALGDIGDNALRWLSPMGWAQGVRAYADERWWTIVVCVLASIALVAMAFRLATLRDLGSGLLADRGGPARAAASLGRPLGLAARLQRGMVIGWMVGMFTTGVVYGSMGRDIEEMVADNPTFADILAQLEGASVTDSFFATALSMMAMIASGFSIAAVLRLRSEEGAGRAEPILAGPVSRGEWVASHLVVGVVGTVLVVAAGGLGVGISYAVVSGDADEILRMTGAAFATVPPILVLVGLTVTLFGVWPRGVVVAWAALAVVVVVGLLGELLRLPEWSRQVSPFEHAPGLPADSMSWPPLLALLVIAAALAAAGMRGFRVRDLRVE